MKNAYLSACVSALALVAATTTLAQDVPATEDNATIAEVAPTSSEEWGVFSSNDRTLYLIDLKGFSPIGDATTVRVARVPTQGATTLFVHRIDEYELRCRANQARLVTEVELDDNGDEIERYPEADAEWEDVRPTSLPAHFKAIACDNARPSGATADSIKAFISRGRQ